MPAVAQARQHGGGGQGQAHRHLRSARRVHADLLGEARPGYLANLDALKARGVDEIWCVSVNDGYVMAAWGRDQDAIGKIRMLGDGNAELAKKLGLENDSTKSGMGIRSRRFSLLVEDGVVKQVNVEQPGKFEVSNAETMLTQLG